MKLDNYNNQQRIFDFLKSSDISLSEEGMKQAAEELETLGVMSSPVKLGDFLYLVNDFDGREPKIEWVEVIGIFHTDDKRIVVRLDQGAHAGWWNIEKCFFTYEEAKELLKKLQNERKKTNEDEDWILRRRELLEHGKRDMVDALSEKMKKNCFAGLSSDAINILSSAIVSNGMLVAPVKVGDTVYQVFENDEESWIEEGTVTAIAFDGTWEVSVDNEDFEDLDEYILTYEEAERVLKE